MRPSNLRIWMAAAPAVLLAACGGFGTVNQGQVIAYEHATGKITLVVDSNYRDPAHPRFDVLPPVSVQTPEDPAEMGPLPEAGKLLQVDPRARRLWVFSGATQRIEEVAYQELGTRAGCASGPIVDRERKTIAICVDRKTIVVSVAEQYLALPDDTWKTGDEVRYYYKDSGRALRMMNVTKTNLNKGGE